MEAENKATTLIKQIKELQVQNTDADSGLEKTASR